jgi:hypothetical protein
MNLSQCSLKSTWNCVYETDLRCLFKKHSQVLFIEILIQQVCVRTRNLHFWWTSPSYITTFWWRLYGEGAMLYFPPSPNTRVWNQDLTLARQVAYHLNYASRLFKLFFYALPKSSYLCFLNNWNGRHVPPWPAYLLRWKSW